MEILGPIHSVDRTAKFFWQYKIEVHQKQIICIVGVVLFISFALKNFPYMKEWGKEPVLYLWRWTMPVTPRQTQSLSKVLGMTMYHNEVEMAERESLGSVVVAELLVSTTRRLSGVSYTHNVMGFCTSVQTRHISCEETVDSSYVRGRRADTIPGDASTVTVTDAKLLKHLLFLL